MGFSRYVLRVFSGTRKSYPPRYHPLCGFVRLAPIHKALCALLQILQERIRGLFRFGPQHKMFEGIFVPGIETGVKLFGLLTDVTEKILHLSGESILIRVLGSRHKGSSKNRHKNSGQLDHKITFNMLYFLLNYRSLFDTVEYFQNLGFHNNAFVIGALLRPEYLNIRHLPEHVLNYIKQILTDKINERPGYLLEDSYRNLLSYIQEPLEKNLSNSFDQLSILDKRRDLNSKEIFTNLYTLKGN